ncbi:unnamed protein product [Amoebophrya sp. A25]|nr:unnamed protein product [Amoebophrya sp. A25]|eukprot:GSA25T00004153001.1
MHSECPLESLQLQALSEKLVGTPGSLFEPPATRSLGDAQGRCQEIFASLATVRDAHVDCAESYKDFKCFHPSFMDLVAPSVAHMLRYQPTLEACLTWSTTNKEMLNKFCWLQKTQERNRQRKQNEKIMRKAKVHDSGKKVVKPMGKYLGSNASPGSSIRGRHRSSKATSAASSAPGSGLSKHTIPRRVIPFEGWVSTLSSRFAFC